MHYLCCGLKAKRFDCFTKRSVYKSSEGNIAESRRTIDKFTARVQYPLFPLTLTANISKMFDNANLKFILWMQLMIMQQEQRL